jgi:iron(III) transport system permease protein
MDASAAQSAPAGVGAFLERLLNGRTLMVVMAAVTLALVVVLLAVIAQVAFQHRAINGTTTYTLRNFINLYSDRFAYETLINTTIFALVATVVSLAFAAPIAWLTERTDMPGSRWVFPLLTATLLVPSFFTAMGWQLLFHSRVGLVNQWLVQVLPFDRSPLNINTVFGMGLVEGFSLIALAFVMVVGSVRSMDPALEESAQVHGLPLWRRLRRITIPLVWPGILAAGLYVLTIAIAAFDVPAIIGMSNRIFTFSTFVYSMALPVDGVPDYGSIAASSALMLLIALAVSWWYLRVISKANRYAVVTGRNYRPQPIALGKWWVVAWGFILLTVILVLVLPLAVMIWVAVTPVLTVPSMDALNRVSLGNFRNIPWRNFWPAASNSAILTLVVPTLTTVAGLAISWVVIRSRLKVAGAFDMLAFLPHVVPHIIFAVGAMLLALFWLPSFLPLYGTLTIIMLVYIIGKISFATRIFNSSLLQIHQELDEAGSVFGLSSMRVFRRILMPLLAPVLVYSWLWMALLTLRELTVAAFLVTRENNTLPVFIWSIWTDGNMNMSAAVSLVLMAGMIPILIAFFAISRRWTRGII